MLALFRSTIIQDGPKVAVRNFTRAVVSGATGEDIVEINGAALRGEGYIPLVKVEGGLIFVRHRRASGAPVTVELE